MMSRGTFNGPGGTHNRWQVPNKGGSGLGPHHLLHFKNQLNVLTPTDQITLQRDTLQNSGIAVVRLQSREFSPNGSLVGLTLDFVAGAEGGDLAGTCANQGYTCRRLLLPEPRRPRLLGLPRGGRRPRRQRLLRARPRRAHLEEPRHAARRGSG